MNTSVGYLGPDTATYGYLAARTHFGNGDDVDLVPIPSHQDICSAVARQKFEMGVIAIENSIDGFVPECVRAMRKAEAEGGIRIQAEVVVPIELFYMQKASEDIHPTVVKSHPKALAQCDSFVRELQRSGIRVEECASTSEAALEASRDPKVAAIANAIAESKYGLRRIVRRSVVNGGRAWTRFWVIGKHHGPRTGNDKTALLFSLERDEPATLWQTLGCFVAEETDRGVYQILPPDRRPNLLVQYPVPITGRAFEYNFLVEFAGHIDDKAICDGIARFESCSLSLSEPQVLGSYANMTGELGKTPDTWFAARISRGNPIEVETQRS